MTAGAHPEIHLEQVLDLGEVQRIQDTFSMATGFASMMVGKTGIPLTRASNFRPICALIRSTERGRARCASCDAAGGYAALSSGQVHTYVCSNGLIDVAAPITVDGAYLGGIYCGQVLPEDSRDELIEEILRRNEYLGLPREELRALARRIPVLPRERIQAAAELLQLMAGQIVQQGLSRLERADRARGAAAGGPQAPGELDQALLSHQSLFSSLALVRSTAREEGAQRTEEIAHCLSEMLRHSLRGAGGSATLAEELEVARHYLRLQQIRLGPRLRVEIAADPALLRLPLPRMTLQPLVENAVVHGAEPLLRPVTVQVRAYQWIEGVMIQVCDDGAGVERATAARLNQGGGQVGGLAGVVRRLQAEHGARCAVRVEGGPGLGTQVMLYLPLQPRAEQPGARPGATAEPARQAKPPRDGAAPLARALDYMQRNLQRPDLRLGEVAEAAVVSPSHLAALIRRQLGRSYLAHLTHLRIERAKELLRTTDLTVAAVAAAVGYETPAPFYQRFKQATGVTPGSYRGQAPG